MRLPALAVIASITKSRFAIRNYHRAMDANRREKRRTGINDSVSTGPYKAHVGFESTCRQGRVEEIFSLFLPHRLELCHHKVAGRSGVGAGRTDFHPAPEDFDSGGIVTVALMLAAEEFVIAA